MAPKCVVVMGLGYVGCVSLACLAELGHKVIGVDLDTRKTEMIAAGKSPFYEPGLEELVSSNLRKGRLSVSPLDESIVEEADVILLCVGTPSQANGNIELQHLRRVCSEIAAKLKPRKKPLVVTVRSTVFPGTCEELHSSIIADDQVAVASNPEFLREGTAVKDFMEPSLLVVGATSDEAAASVAELYETLPVHAEVVCLRTAEMIKYACNAFHAVKIGFANEIGSLAANLGVSPQQVMATVCKDTKLNISPAYMKPGFAFGGSCLPKDLRALTYRASRLDMKLPLLESVLPSNQEQLSRSIRQIFNLPVKKLGFYGLAFKEETDDLRESPVIEIIEYFLGKGREARIFDPRIQISEIYGSNLNFVTSALPHIGKLMVQSHQDLVNEVDALVIAQKPAPDVRQQLEASGLPIIDLTSLAVAQA